MFSRGVMDRVELTAVCALPGCSKRRSEINPTLFHSFVRARLWLAVAAAVLIFFNVPVIAQETAVGGKQPGNLQRWNFTGELTGVYEYYDASGATGQAPYQFLQDHKYADYSLWLSKDVTRYEKVRASMFGTVS